VRFLLTRVMLGASAVAVFLGLWGAMAATGEDGESWEAEAKGEPAADSTPLVQDGWRWDPVRVEWVLIEEAAEAAPSSPPVVIVERQPIYYVTEYLRQVEVPPVQAVEPPATASVPPVGGTAAAPGPTTPAPTTEPVNVPAPAPIPAAAPAAPASPPAPAAPAAPAAPVGAPAPAPPPPPAPAAPPKPAASSGKTSKAS